MKTRLFALILAALSLNGCMAVAAIEPLKNRFEDDLKAFVKSAEKYGTETDKSCARTISAQWDAINELIADDSGGIIAGAYRTIVVSRITQASQANVVSGCGPFAAELALAIARRVR